MLKCTHARTRTHTLTNSLSHTHTHIHIHIHMHAPYRCTTTCGCCTTAEVHTAGSRSLSRATDPHLVLTTLPSFTRCVVCGCGCGDLSAFIYPVCGCVVCGCGCGDRSAFIYPVCGDLWYASGLITLLCRCVCGALTLHDLNSTARGQPMLGEGSLELHACLCCMGCRLSSH